MQSLQASSSRAVNRSKPQQPLNRGLGWFSLALGAAELLAPRVLARAIGLQPSARSTWMLRLFGLREVAAGANIFLQPGRAMPLWTRVAGDALDVTCMALAARGAHAHKGRAAVALGALAGATAVDVFAAIRTQRQREAAQQPVMFSVTINRPPGEVYAYFRKLSNLPSFMDYLISVEERSDNTSTWTAKIPGGTATWTAEMVEEKEGELIAWRTLDEHPLRHEGRVTFAKAPGRNSTEVRVEVRAALPGFAGASRFLAKMIAKPQIKGDLRRLKQVLETGEVVFSDASVHRGPHAAQPADPTPELDERLAQPTLKVKPKRTTRNAMNPSTVTPASPTEPVDAEASSTKSPGGAL